MNLLIDGMPGCGKSTAIDDALRARGLFSYCAGFRTVRVMSSGGERWGFAQLPASEDAGVAVVSDKSLPHMILDFRKTQPFIPETFTGFTINSLKQAPGEPRLILMDEIGGTELGLPEVNRALLSTMKGPVPCIGVIKSDVHARKFDYAKYRGFRTRVENETDTEFLYMNTENREEVRERIYMWLSRNVPARRL